MPSRAFALRLFIRLGLIAARVYYENPQVEFWRL